MMKDSKYEPAAMMLKWTAAYLKTVYGDKEKADKENHDKKKSVGGSSPRRNRRERRQGNWHYQVAAYPWGLQRQGSWWQGESG